MLRKITTVDNPSNQTTDVTSATIYNSNASEAKQQAFRDSLVTITKALVLQSDYYQPQLQAAPTSVPNNLVSYPQSPVIISMPPASPPVIINPFMPEMGRQFNRKLKIIFFFFIHHFI